MKDVQLFVPSFRVDECLAQVRECLERGWTGLGYKTVDFEKAWSGYAGLPNAHFLNSATAGLHLAVKLLKEQGRWQAGDEVITTPLTFVSSNHAILYEGLKPVFADVDSQLCLDPESVLAHITPRTRAVLFVGLGGNVGQYGRILELCKDRGLALILDAAHMSGTRWHGRHVGSEADAAVFSFQAVKNLPTADAGAITFRDGGLAQEVRKWSWLGIDKDTYTRTLGDGAYKWMYDVPHVGYKYHGNAVMAALALVGLKYLDEDNRRRRELAALYDEALGGDARIERVPMAPDCEPSRHLYQVQVPDRDRVLVRLNQQRIFPGVHYRDNTVYPMYAQGGPCPRARRASDRLLSLPLHLQLADEDVRRVASSLRSALDASA
jgi:dTDP-4-amino-4,6-dideoxygalactose transaminase